MRDFDEIEMRALRTWSKEWDSGFNNTERLSFVANHKLMVKHVENAERLKAAAAEAEAESLASRRFKTTMRYTAIALCIALLQLGVAFATRTSQPATIVVKLPSGQQVVVTPAPTPNTGGQP